MAMGSFDSSGSGQPMAEINTTPLVDVMLVLLVIFIITAPLMTHAIKLELPQAQAPSSPEKPETVTVSIDRAGALAWNNEPVADLEALGLRLAQAANGEKKPDLHLRADSQTHYERIAKVMAAAQGAGISSISFVTDPGAQRPAAAEATTP
jgi:biopolymer transport protein ExbD